MLIGIFVTVLFLLIILSMVWPPDSPWAPWWRTNKRVAQIICKLSKVSKSDIIYDLGCGDATVLITAVSQYGAKGIGVEIDPLRYWVARVRVTIKGLGKNISLKRKNFFSVSFPDATIVIVYLVPATLKKLKQKFLDELAPGTKIVSYKYMMDLPLIATNKKEKVYVYKIPKSKST